MDIEKNYEIYIEKLKKLGIDTEVLDHSYGDIIKKATFSPTTDSGMCGEGSLIEVVLKILTPYAVRLNELLPENIRVDKNELVKICLLHQIAKAKRLVPNDNQWEIEKRGIVFKYDASQPSIRTGLHSLMMCINCGIMFTPEESEAMTVNDRDLTDMQSRYHSSILASIVRQANEMAYMQLNAKII